MKYKALIADLDGTLIPNKINGLPSNNVIGAIKKAKKRIHFSIASGRAPWQAKPILDVLQLSTPVVLLNGALIIDGTTRKPIYQQPLLQKDFDTIISILHKSSLRFSIDDYEKTMEGNAAYKTKDPLTIFLWDLTEAQATILIRRFSHIPTISIYKVTGWNKGTICLNIAHKLATKQHGISRVAKLLGINTHEIIGIGDGPNDFPLLMACGFKVAMGNAIPDLKAIADYVTLSVEEDGLANVIENFVLKD